MAKYQRILYDYARPTWRWDGKQRENEEKRLRRLKDEALANSKNKQTLFNTRRAYAKNRNLDLSLETNVLFLSKYYGERCNDIEIIQHTIGKNQREKNLRKNGPNGGNEGHGEKEREEIVDTCGEKGRGEKERGDYNLEEVGDLKRAKENTVRRKGKGKGLRKGIARDREIGKTRNEWLDNLAKDDLDIPSPSCSLPEIRLPSPQEVSLPHPSSSAVESSCRRFDTLTNHLPPLQLSARQQQQQKSQQQQHRQQEPRGDSSTADPLPDILSPKRQPKHNSLNKTLEPLTLEQDETDKCGKSDATVRKAVKKREEEKVEEGGWKLGGWKPRTPNSTKYFIYRHYYEPESVFNHDTTQSTNIFRTVGKVDLLQAKRKPNNTLSTPNVVMTTKYV